MKKKVDEYQTVRIWKKTQKQLKMMALTQGFTLVEFMQYLADEELKRMKERGSVTNFP